MQKSSVEGKPSLSLRAGHPQRHGIRLVEDHMAMILETGELDMMQRLFLAGACIRTHREPGAMVNPSN
jgi:hypothetical protein